jgi:hypothetical protein
VSCADPHAHDRSRGVPQLDVKAVSPLCQDQVRHQGQQLLVELEG